MWFVMTLAVACAVVAVGGALLQSAPPRRSQRRPKRNDISVTPDSNDISVTPGR